MSEVRTQPKRLIDLNPKWVKRAGDGAITGILFDCPCGAAKRDEPGSHFHGWPICEGGRVYIPLFGDHAWRCHLATLGNDADFASLSLEPSVHLPGHWHGFVTNGEVTSC